MMCIIVQCDFVVLVVVVWRGKEWKDATRVKVDDTHTHIGR